MSYLFLSIVAIIYGALLGNYLTSAYHRIPRGKPINGLSRDVGIKPHCSVCNHELKYYEYFPILSWIFTRQRCNYCGAPVDMAYTLLEVGMMIVSLLAFALFGMNLTYVLFTLFAATIVLFTALLASRRKFYFKSFCFVLVSGIIFYMWG